MPDCSDVEQAVAGLVASVLYPNGTDTGSIVGTVCRVYRGWPVSGALEADVGRGAVHVTVQTVAGSLRDRTRYPQDWLGVTPPTTLQVDVEGEVVQFSGDTALGQAAGVKVDGQTYVYRVQDGDTPELVAAVLAGMIRNDRPALLSDTSITLTGGLGVVARVVSDGQGGRELRRQDALFRVTFWCPDPTTRDQVASLVDLALADLTFMDVGGWGCRIRLSGNSSTDDGAGGGIWRRDLLYSIEYPTVTAEILPAMLFGLTNVNGVPYTV